MVRPRRKAANSQAASSIYYLGYVEENESPASIMKKFEELEKLQRQNSLAPDQSLNESQMQELFKKTSTFSIENILDELYEYDDDLWYLNEDEEGNQYGEGDLQREYYSSAEEAFENEIDEDVSLPEAKTSVSSQRRSVTKRQRSLDTVNFNISLLLKSGKRSGEVKDDFISTVKLPSPIPHTWAHLITHSTPNSLKNHFRLIVDSSTLATDKGLYKNPTSPNSDTPITIECLPFDKSKILAVILDFSNMNSFSTLPPIDSFISQGFLFIWSRKSNIPRIIEYAHKFGFKYCENICWIKMTMFHKLKIIPSPVINECKETLFVFRRFKDTEMELKHQRNADCIFDFDKAQGKGKPAQIYHIIETLIPEKEPKVKSFVEISDSAFSPVGVSERWCRIVI